VAPVPPPLSPGRARGGAGPPQGGVFSDTDLRLKLNQPADKDILLFRTDGIPWTAPQVTSEQNQYISFLTEEQTLGKKRFR
jgi:hypothetical protein